MINANLTLTFPQVFFFKLKLNAFLLIFCKRQGKETKLTSKIHRYTWVTAK